MKKLLLASCLLLLVAGCKGKEEITTKEGDFRVEKLFTKDGCTVYRFLDGLRLVYYTTCSGTVQEYNSDRDKSNVVQTVPDCGFKNMQYDKDDK